MRLSTVSLVSAAVAAALIAAATPARSAEFGLAPLRRVVTETARETTFVVSNPSDRPLKARVDWVDLAATEDGYRPATRAERAASSASPYLTLSPAFLSLAPGQSATIRIAVKKGARIPAGEKRSHLLVETDAVRSPLHKAGGLAADIGLSITVPVVLRGGAGAAEARLGDTRLARAPDGALELQTEVAPAGRYSAYGKLVVRFIDAATGGERQLGVKRNVAAWIDARRRRYVVPLGQPRLPAGRLVVDYVGEEEYEGVVIATREFSIKAP
ncbi:MAG: hypothetical protein K2Q06_05460 [Parvularculaceae bacterium]|nr:hypothetical protein [Parvularculaceae bacterium]